MENNDIKTEKLIRFIDGELNEADKTALAGEIAADHSLAEELNNLSLAKEVVRSYGLAEQVKGIHAEMMAERQMREPQKKQVVRMFPRMLLRVAAGIILLMLVFGVYRYTAISPDKLFEEQYSGYQLPVMRGEGEATAAETAYRSKSYDKVIAINAADTATDVYGQFLAAQSYLAKKQYPNAVSMFRNVIQENKVAGTSILNDDAEYYLALSYLKNDHANEALALFKQIRNNSTHLYHSKVNSWFITKLALLPGKH